MKPARSLKARALQLLSQREQSRVELRRKLLAYLQADLKADEAKAIGARRSAESDPGEDDVSAGLADPANPADRAEPADPASQVEEVLDWLAAHQFASDERFAESRVHARSARYGNLRIRQELKQHAVALTPEATQALQESEEARASEVYRRRFDAPADSAAEKAKRSRFLATRGFSPDVIRRVLRAGGRREAGNDAGG